MRWRGDQPQCRFVTRYRLSSYLCVFHLFIQLQQWWRFHFCCLSIYHLGLSKNNNADLHTHTHTRELCQQMRGWCPGGCVSWGYWALTKETQGRTTAANTADFTQLHTYTSRQQRADTQRETATLFRDYTQPLCVSHTKCRHTCAHTLAHTDTNTHTTQQTQFRKSIWDQETNYLNYFPFFPPSLSSTCFPAFYFSCVCICEYFG